MKITAYNTFQNRPSFKAWVYEGTISSIFEGELRPQLRNAKTDKEKKEVLNLAEAVLKKTKEILTWDGKNGVKIGSVYIPEAKTSGLGIMDDPVFPDCEDKIIISPEQIKKDGWAKSFLNLKKEDYLRIRKPKIIEYAQNIAKSNSYGCDLREIRKKLGADSYKIFEATYLKIKKSKSDTFEEKLKKDLELIG